MGQLTVPLIMMVAAVGIMYLTRPKPADQRGPRLQDLKVTTSAYGKPIPMLRGIGRVGGNIIQASEIREIEHEEKISGGKGGSSSSSYSYTAEVDLVVMIGEGEVDDILRIWADGKLIMDRTPNGQGNFSKQGLIYRFYKGTEDQLPDPLVEQMVGAEYAPAYRGRSVVVFEKLDLADYGNRIPQLTFEYTEVSTPIESYIKLEGDAGSFINIQPRVAIDFETRKGYLVRGAPDTTWEPEDTLLVEFDIDTMQVLRQDLFSNIIHPNMLFDPTDILPGNLCIGRHDHMLYISAGQDELSKQLMIDPVTFKQGNHASPDPLGTYYGQFSLEYIRPPGEELIWRRFPPFGPREILVGQRGLTFQMKAFDAMGAEVIYNIFTHSHSIAIFQYYIGGPFYHVDDLITHTILGRDTTEVGTPFGGTFFVPAQDERWELVGYLCHGGAHSNTGLMSYNTGLLADIVFGTLTFGPQSLATQEVLQSIGFANVDPGAICWGEIRRLMYVPVDNTCLLFVDTVQSMLSGTTADMDDLRHWCVKLRGDEIVWVVEIPPLVIDSNSFLVRNSTTASQPNYLGGVFKYASDGNVIVELNVLSGGYTTFTYAAPGPLTYYQFYDAMEDAIYMMADAVWTKLVLGRAQGQGVSLAQIITDLCAKVGLTSDDIDVTQLTGPEYTVQGFQATKVASVRANLEPLQVPYTFYCVESDYKLHFRAIGFDSLADIEEGELLASDNNPPLKERRTQEMDLPAEVSITFPDPTRDHNTNTASFRRPANPLAVMSSDNKIDVELPVGENFEKMKRAAQKHLYSVWMERWSYAGKLGWEYLWLNPGDGVTMLMRDGAQLPQRLDRMTIGADFTIEFDARSADAATYVPTAVGEGGNGVVQQTFPQLTSSRLFVMDLPLLIDSHTAGAGFNMDYLAVSSYGTPAWRGASIHKSPDNSAWAMLETTLHEAAYGIVGDVLPDDLSPWATDTSLVIRVYMVARKDSIESVTYSEMLNGANAAAILIGDGAVEVIQFQTVTEDDDGSLLLTNILRGRRGTDAFCGLHAAGETIVFLKPSTTLARTKANSEIGNSHYYKAVSVGQQFQDARTVSFSNYGNDLKPYMPTSITATLDGADIDLAWVRRTRIGGELIDSTGDVPLSEDAEEYEVDIYDATGDNVLRTLSGLTSPGVVYASADIAADFGSTPTELNLMVYQISAQVGRGFSRLLTITVES